MIPTGEARVLSGPAVLQRYGYGEGVLDLVRQIDAPSAHVHVWLAGPVRRLRVPDGAMEVTLEAPSTSQPAVVIVLPDGQHNPLSRIRLVNVRAALQGWPRALDLESGSIVLGQLASGSVLDRLTLRGAVTFQASTVVRTLSAEDAHLSLGGRVEAHVVQGDALHLEPLGDEQCELVVRNLPNQISFDLARGALLHVEPSPGSDSVVESPVLSGDGTVRICNSTISDPQFRGALDVAVSRRSRLLDAHGEIASVTVDDGSGLYGEPRSGFSVGVVASAAGAELSELNAFRLSRRSLVALADAAHASFWLGTTVRDGTARAKAMSDRADNQYLSAYWSALLRLLEVHGAPGRSRLVARRAEMDYRRRALPLASGDRIALELMRPIRYGQSFLAPLLAQLGVSVLAALVMHVTHSLTDPSVTGTLLEIPRLFLAPLGLTTQLPAFMPEGTPGPLDTAIWLVCLLSGLFLFSAAALAARRRITYA